MLVVGQLDHRVAEITTLDGADVLGVHGVVHTTAHRDRDDSAHVDLVGDLLLDEIIDNTSKSSCIVDERARRTPAIGDTPCRP
jgi:hypothetical protein